MKRPPQLWMISVGFLCLSLLHTTYSLRATSLIFSKTTTTTSTTEAPDTAVSAVSEASPETNETVVTKPPLTGIPQIDYRWDPNLPFELKGYNLSDYPFYDRVPPIEEIDFKCDGLHDGFYASVVHKCQVYHHCLFGTRFDFLCANFTAFDQRTFICQFASDVDCINSHNFWHRNDALYQAASTVAPVTTIAPPVITAAPQLPGIRRPIASLGGGARRRRPFRRRRPQYDYYYDDEEYESDRERDDYYDDPPRSAGRRRKQRPRTTTRRPDFEEYEEYEDERYDGRGTGRRDETRERRPYDRRGDEDRRYDDRRPTTGSKNKDKRINEDDSRRPTETERRRPSERTPSEDRRRPNDDRRNDDDLERRPYERPRKPLRDVYEDDKDEDRRSYDRPRKTDDTKTDRRTSERPRKDDSERRYRPKEVLPVEDEKIERRQSDRPRKDEDDRRYRPKEVKPIEEEEKNERRVSNRPRKPLDDDDTGRFRAKESKAEERIRPTEDRVRPSEESKVLIRPNSGSSVYDRPRAAPIIRRPVPKTEREKFDYKPAASTKPPRKEVIEDEEYYDEYEDEPKLPPPKPSRKPARLNSGTINHEIRAAYSRPRQSQIQSRRPVDEVEDEPRRPAAKRPRPESDRVVSGSKKLSVAEEEYEDEYEEENTPSKDAISERSKASKETPPAKIETTSKEIRPEPIVRVVKRPFLPSRGGNPYSARGLQPVGNKALDTSNEDEVPRRDYSDEETANKQKSNLQNNDATTKASAEINNRQPLRSTERKQSEEDAVYDDEIEEEFKPLTSRPRGDFRYRNDLPRTTQKPKVPDPVRNPLDINENEYDVTLNDALNPTIPNLPVRSVPTGFSSGRDSFGSQNYQRPRLIEIDSPALSPAGSDYVYQIKPRDSIAGQPSRYNPYVTVQQLNYRHPSTGAQYYSSFQ